tara:strand:- start:178 stop:504 length:327 start_codon:yes stop_codon:yes gene_type:complete
MKLDDLFESLKLEFAKDQRGLSKPEARPLNRSSVSYDNDTKKALRALLDLAEDKFEKRPSASQLFSALVNSASPTKPTKPTPKAKRKAKPSSKDNLAAEIRKHAAGKK